MHGLVFFIIQKGAVTVDWISANARHFSLDLFRSLVGIILHFRFGFSGVRRTFDYTLY
jgi:hypothetical protein